MSREAQKIRSRRDARSVLALGCNRVWPCRRLRVHNDRGMRYKKRDSVLCGNRFEITPRNSRPAWNKETTNSLCMSMKHSGSRGRATRRIGSLQENIGRRYLAERVNKRKRDCNEFRREYCVVGSPFCVQLFLVCRNFRIAFPRFADFRCMIDCCYSKGY